MKHYKCKHLIGLASIYSHVKISNEAKSVLIGQNRKRGHPQATIRALQLQPNNTQNTPLPPSKKRRGRLPKKKLIYFLESN